MFITLALEPCWYVAQVSNVDEVLSLHMNMLNTCLHDCMLTNPELLKTLSKLQSVCILYCNFMQVSTHKSYSCKVAVQTLFYFARNHSTYLGYYMLIVGRNR